MFSPKLTLFIRSLWTSSQPLSSFGNLIDLITVIIMIYRELEILFYEIKSPVGIMKFHLLIKADFTLLNISFTLSLIISECLIFCLIFVIVFIIYLKYETDQSLFDEKSFPSLFDIRERKRSYSRYEPPVNFSGRSK